MGPSCWSLAVVPVLAAGVTLKNLKSFKKHRNQRLYKDTNTMNEVRRLLHLQMNISSLARY